MTLDKFNRQSDQAASTALSQCCSSQTWAQQMLQSRPFVEIQQLFNLASDLPF